jgi:dihydrofolate synthase/folylpolyglutamate synthase
VGLTLTRYSSALEYLFARTTGSVRFGLERTRALLAEMGGPHLAYPVIHLAGTNGKGSSVATADALLRTRGLRVGRYTSPHLVDFRERIAVDGVPISSDEVVAFVEQWTPTVERLGASFFEATTALAFAHFARATVDVAIVETGLGGRLDSTNVVDPVAAGVTSIGYDHMEYLGDTLEAIAGEKAGIFKPGRPAVIGEPDAVVRGYLARDARAVGAGPVRVVVEESEITELAVTPHGTRFRLRALGDDRLVQTPLVGRHQAMNFAFTVTLLDAAGAPFAVSLEQAADAAPGIRLPGRFQRVGHWIFDVAHNADGIRTLVANLRLVAHERPVVALLCVLGDKDWRAMLEALAPVVSHFVLTNAPTAPASRAWSLDEAIQHARATGLHAEAEPDFDRALEAAERGAGTVLVTGSFHTVGDAMARLQVSPFTG